MGILSYYGMLSGREELKNCLAHLRKMFHFQWILVCKYSYTTPHCWHIQRSGHTHWDPQSTHRYLISDKGIITQLMAFYQGFQRRGSSDGRMDNTFTDVSISNISLFTSTVIGTVTVCAVSIFVAYIRFSRTLVDIWCYKNINDLSCLWDTTSNVTLSTKLLNLEWGAMHE